jgi:hypothetical protein
MAAVRDFVDPAQAGGIIATGFAGGTRFVDRFADRPGSWAVAETGGRAMRGAPRERVSCPVRAGSPLCDEGR